LNLEHGGLLQAGMLEYWNYGIMKKRVLGHWDNALMENFTLTKKKKIPSFHYSIVPLFHFRMGSE